MTPRRRLQAIWGSKHTIAINDYAQMGMNGK